MFWLTLFDFCCAKFIYIDLFFTGTPIVPSTSTTVSTMSTIDITGTFLMAWGIKHSGYKQ